MVVQAKNDIDVLLAKSFKELVAKTPIEKITIKQITDKAGVIRPTFYNHFQDKYELLEWIIYEELLRPIQMLIENNMFEEALTLLFTNIEKDEEFYSQAVRLEGQNSFEKIAENGVRHIILDLMEVSQVVKKVQYGWLTAERIAEYYSKGMCSIVINWIKGNYPISARELAATYAYLMHCTLEQMLTGNV